MNLPAFLVAYKHAAESLKHMTVVWASLPLEERQEARQGLVEVLVRRAELLLPALEPSTLAEVLEADRRINTMANVIKKVIGLDVLKFLYPED